MAYTSIQFTEKEKEALLILFKDFSSYYSAGSLSKIIKISRIGTMNMLKKFLKRELVSDEKIGKSIIYKLNLEDDYVRSLITFLLADEANRFRRWKEEFKEIYKEGRVVLFYGSASRNYSQAKDIDVMVLRKKNESVEIRKAINKRQRFLPKKIHTLDMTSEEFIKNVKHKNGSIIEIVKTAVVLYGHSKYVELMKNVTRI